MTVPYTKPKLIYDGFVDGFLRIGRRDYIPISSIILIMHNRGMLALNLKKMYSAKGRFINIAREEKVHCFIIIGLKGDSFCVSCPIDPVKLTSYITQWKLGGAVPDEDPWDGLGSVYGHWDKYGKRINRECKAEARAEKSAGPSEGVADVVAPGTPDL